MSLSYGAADSRVQPYVSVGMGTLSGSGGPVHYSGGAGLRVALN